jgi:hypothetical protein
MSLQVANEAARALNQSVQYNDLAVHGNFLCTFVCQIFLILIEFLLQVHNTLALWNT